MIISLEIY